jgi:uncharacterized membrane protein YfcA
MENLVGPIIGIAFVALFTVFFVFMGIVLIVRSRRDKDKARQSQSWPSALGKVLESRVMTTISSGEDGSTDMYKPYVKYEYSADGVRYTNDKLRVGMTISSSKTRSSQEMVDRHPVGSDVRVYYNPANPGDSVLEQKGPSGVLLVIGIILLVIGLGGGIPGLTAMLVSVFSASQ